MSPEQASGEAVSPRSDIYSLGVIAYRLLTGSPVFGGTSAQELLAAHLTVEPTPVRTLEPGVPETLSDAVMQCLRKRAADRWTSAAELARMLRRHQHEFEAAILRLGGPDAPWVPTSAQWRRARLAAGVAVPALLAIGALATRPVPWAPQLPADEAHRIAASFFESQGASTRVAWHERTLLTTDSVGGDIARRRLGAGVSSWALRAVLGGWTIVHYLPGSPGRWSATVGGTGQIVAFERPSPEGAIPEPSDSAGRAIARGFLARAGWRLDELAPESTTQRRHGRHVDRTVIWSRLDSALEARVRVRLVMAGDTVTRLGSSLEFGSDVRARREQVMRIQQSGTFVLLPVLAAALAVVVRKRWRRRAQWDVAARLALVGAVPLTIALCAALVADPWLGDPSFDPSTRDVSAVAVTASVFAVALGGALLTTAAILLFAGAASVAAKQAMPHLLRGLQVIAMPDRRVLAPGLLAGACYGLMAAAAGSTVELLGRMPTGEVAVYVRAVELPSIAAALQVLADGLASAILVVFLIGLVATVAGRFVRSTALLVVVAATVATALMVPGFDVPDFLASAAILLMVAAVACTYGLVPAIGAAAVAGWVSDIEPLLHAPSSDTALAGVAAVAAVALVFLRLLHTSRWVFVGAAPEALPLRS
jgi:hypothetical protein